MGSDGSVLTITPENAGWAYSGLMVFDLAEHSTVTVEMSGIEGVLVPLSAENLTAIVNGDAFEMTGRSGVFAKVSDWLYVPLGSTLTVEGERGEIALCTAKATKTFPVKYTKAEDVSVEVRGSGMATRQVTNIATPTSFDGAHKINVCEVLTPGGNWSSWPPHRHDGIGECPYTNEEIYYFRMGKLDSDHGVEEGAGLFRVYTVDGSKDETASVMDGDVYLVPQGYHGPTVAPPEYPMYFLNVLAGPDEDRTMAFCDDPSHHWIRDSWETQTPDPRCPMTSARGRAH